MYAYLVCIIPEATIRINLTIRFKGMSSVLAEIFFWNFVMPAQVRKLTNVLTRANTSLVLTCLFKTWSYMCLFLFLFRLMCCVT